VTEDSQKANSHLYETTVKNTSNGYTGLELDCDHYLDLIGKMPPTILGGLLRCWRLRE